HGLFKKGSDRDKHPFCGYRIVFAETFGIDYNGESVLKDEIICRQRRLFFKIKSYGQDNVPGIVYGFAQKRIVFLRLAEDYIKDNYIGTGVVQFFYKAGKLVTAPGPPAETFYALFVDSRYNNIAGRF